MAKPNSGGGMPRAAARKERRQLAREARRRELQHDRRTTALKRIGGWGAAVAVVLAVVVFIVRTTGAGVSYSGDLRTGGKLESLTLPQLERSGTISYAALADKPLVLNFFASWCEFCRAEMPAFEQVHQALGSKVAFLGVSQSDGKQASVNLAHQAGITYQTGIDAQGSLFHAFGGTGMPVTVFIRPGGQVAEIHAGALDQTSLTSLIQRHFGVQ